MRIVCISDTHRQHRRIQVPDGDVLIHAGDFCGRGTLAEVEDFNKWLGTLPHAECIVIAGNHDLPFEEAPEAARELITYATYLEDSGIEIDGIRFWGSPWQPEFFNWAFNLPRGPALAEKWAMIPDGTDVVITHGPPYGYGDLCFDGMTVGCADLLAALDRCGARLHVSGHIHEGYGVYERAGMKIVNASTCDFHYRPVNPAVIIDL